MDSSKLFKVAGLQGIKIDPKKENITEGIWNDIESLIFDGMYSDKHPFRPFGSIRVN
jgi:hypothetical protein